MKRQDSQRLGLLKETLEVIFGLDKAVLNRVIGVIKGSKNSVNVRTPIVRVRIGALSMIYLDNAIKYARKNNDSSKKKETMKESFIHYLINETTIDVDLNDQQKSVNQLRQAQRMNRASPERFNRSSFNDAKEEQKKAQQSAGEDPVAHLKILAAKKKAELAMIHKRIMAAEKIKAKQTGVV